MGGRQESAPRNPAAQADGGRGEAAAAAERARPRPRRNEPAQNRRPAAPPSEEPDPKAQKNFTDPEAAHEDQGRVHSGLHAQAAVDATAQVIVAHGLDARQSDQHQLAPIAERSKPIWAGAHAVSADAGYAPRPTCGDGAARDRRLYRARRPSTRAREGGGRGRRHAREDQGRRPPQAYRLRKQLPEPVFGQIKQARGFRQFLCAGSRKSPPNGPSSASPTMFSSWPKRDSVHRRRRSRIASRTHQTRRPAPPPIPCFKSLSRRDKADSS